MGLFNSKFDISKMGILKRDHPVNEDKTNIRDATFKPTFLAFQSLLSRNPDRHGIYYTFQYQHNDHQPEIVNEVFTTVAKCTYCASNGNQYRKAQSLQQFRTRSLFKFVAMDNFGFLLKYSKHKYLMRVLTFR